MDKLTELVLLLEERIELKDEFYSKKLLRLQSQMGADISKHRRDCHNLYWNSEMFLEFERKRDAELDELYRKLGENQKRIDELKKELQAIAA